jgi:hypothetical protein
MPWLAKNCVASIGLGLVFLFFIEYLVYTQTLHSFSVENYHVVWLFPLHIR